jgi:hypothetical protein
MDRPCSTGCGRQAERGRERCDPCQAVMNRRTTWGSRTGVVCAPPPEAPRATIPSAHLVEAPQADPGRLAAELRLVEARVQAPTLAAPAPAAPLKAPALRRALTGPEWNERPLPPVALLDEEQLQEVEEEQAPTDPREAQAALELEQQMEALEGPAEPEPAQDEASDDTQPAEPAQPEDTMATSRCNAPVSPKCDGFRHSKDGLCKPHYQQRWRDTQGGRTWNPRPLGGKPPPPPAPARKAPASPAPRRAQAAPAAPAPANDLPAAAPVAFDPERLTFDELLACVPVLEQRVKQAQELLARARTLASGGE